MTSSVVGKFASAQGKLTSAWHVGNRRRWVSLNVALVLVACGVTEHPHEGATVEVDTNDDFAPAVGPATVSPAVTTSAPPSTATNTNTTATTTTAPSRTSDTDDPSTAVTSRPTDTSNTTSTATTSNATGNTSTNTATSTAEETTSTATTETAGGGPEPGMTINLGGVDVPSEKVVAFIHIGHSNMAGRARSPSDSRDYHFTDTDPHAYMYHTGSAPELAVEPHTAGDNEAIRGNIGGPGTALVKEAVALAPDHYFVSLGFGQASAYCSQFLPGALYYDKLIAAPKAIKGRVVFGGIFIYLGITERHGSAEDRTGFAQCINELVTAIRTDVGVPDLPALMNDYEVGGTGEFVVGGEVYTAIKPQIDECPTVVSNFALVSTEGVAMQDDHHFNLDGQRTWAQRALETMQTKGWFKWGM
jgi:hypothetical protein